MNLAAMRNRERRIPRIRKMLRQGLMFSEIGRREGVSREYIRQLYQRYFSQEFPDYHETWLESRRTRAVAESARSRWNPETRTVAEAAVRQGLAVRPVPVLAPYIAARAGVIEVNGRQVEVHGSMLARRTSNGHQRRYFHFNISGYCVRQSEFAALLCGNGNLFIVPVEVFPKTGRHTYIYIAEEPLPAYRNRHPRIDWWQYLNPWHLLAGKEDPR